jgi:hypothetical protein
MRKTPELDPKEQFKRGHETAKKLGVDESGKEVEHAFSKIAQAPTKGRLPNSPKWRA